MTDTPTQDSDKKPNPDGAKEFSTPSKPARDGWAKIEILTRPLAAFFAAITIAIIGYFGQSTITELSLQEQNARLYTELLARREDAESSLRKDMFKEVMSGFFEFQDVADIENELSKKVLKLELLAINFGDSLSMGPLFTEMSDDIERVLEQNSESIVDWRIAASDYQNRLRSLARRVASSQLTTVFRRDVAIEFEVPVERIEMDSSGIPSTEWRYTWPNDDPNAHDNMRELDGIRRIFEIQFRNADLGSQSVQVKLVIFKFVPRIVETTGEQGGSEIIEVLEKVVDLEFSLDFFNFPLIDNSRLSNNQRFTLILEKFDMNTIKVVGTVFPGLYASQRDKPFLNEAIQELNDQRGGK